MRTVLALETSSNVGAVCVLRDDIGFNEIVRDDAKLSAWIVPAIDRAMKRAGIGFEQIDAVAFGCGPGAFTGVRTACATAQAIAYARKRPLYAVGSMEALAFFAITARSAIAGFFRATDTFSIILDARMNELFRQNFSGATSSELKLESDPYVEDARAASFDATDLAFGSGALLLAERRGIDRERIDAIRSTTIAAENAWAESIARIARDRAERGGASIDPLVAQPTYVRNNVAKTEAERAASAAQKAPA
jgi:tRNA threonylcarbamoyladenosine biosynthesis protein TsaB